jgi:hypothetical protein
MYNTGDLFALTAELLSSAAAWAQTPDTTSLAQASAGELFRSWTRPERPSGRLSERRNRARRLEQSAMGETKYGR